MGMIERHGPFLDAPFVPDEAYCEFLAGHAGAVASVHFGLGLAERLDCRVAVEPQSPVRLMALLGRLGRIRRHALINSRFYTPALLADPAALDPLLDLLRQLLERGLIDGIVYCDHYLLQRLADLAPDLAANLEALPGVNCLLDSLRKIMAQIAHVAATGFRPPGRIILDRPLNRDIEGLARLSRDCRRSLPGLRLGLLANEGCLPFCPFSLAHDAHIAHANAVGQDRTFALNQGLGCVRILDERPERVLQSPFIRPEDLALYGEHVDLIKLCGRTLGPVFLRRVVGAYAAGRWDGNLLDLLDTPHWLAGQTLVDNRALPPDFAKKVAGCGQDCGRCTYCRDLFARVASPLAEIALPSLGNG